MVWGAERAVAHQRFARRKRIGYRIDAGDIQGFVNGQLGQNARHRAGDEGFACTWRAAHQHVMAPGSSDFQSPFDVLLPLDLNVKRYPITLRLTLNLSVKICR
jgi:hypothetical protein